MGPTLALDIYGTLINPLAIGTSLRGMVGDTAGPMAETWRSKQLEYSFRRGLMGAYETFPHVTRQALDYACAVHDATLSDDNKSMLMTQYRKLDAYSDVATSLTRLRAKGAELHAFSNGIANDIAALLDHAGLSDQITSIVSVDDVKSFKPDPCVYAHFLAQTGQQIDVTWLVSSNPFDVIGAAACGWNTVWVQREKRAYFDTWEHQPTAIVSTLAELEHIDALWRKGDCRG